MVGLDDRRSASLKKRVGWELLQIAELSLDILDTVARPFRRTPRSVLPLEDSTFIESIEELPEPTAPTNGDALTNGNGHKPAQEPEFLVQWGLKLPNGNIVWDNALYCGLPLTTPEQRAVLEGALRKTATDMGFDEHQFLSGYGWVRRIGAPGIQWSEATLTPLVEPEKEGVTSGVPGESSTGSDGESGYPASASEL